MNTFVIVFVIVWFVVCFASTTKKGISMFNRMVK